MTKVYSHLSGEEQVRIDELRNREGLGVCQIALRIGRDKSTVSREPGRGLWVASDENGSYRPYRPKRLKAGAWTSRPFYSAMTAQRKAETRARESRRPMRMSYSPLLAWVMDALRKGWTPERIEGRLKVEWPDDPRMRVFCQIFVGRFGVSFSPFERLFLGRFGFGQSCGLSVIA